MSKNAVAVQKTGTAVASYDGFEEFAGLGMEDVSAQDMAIPFLRILAQLSPQVNKRDGAYVQGAEAGMIYNTVANEVYDGEKGVVVVPCYYSRRMIEWKPREQGGGYVGAYEVDDPIVKTTFRDQRGNDVLPNGNYLQNTAQFFVLVLTEDGGVQRCLITMTSTQLKKARQWMTQIQSLTARGKNGTMFTLPMMSHKYLLRTVEQRNDKGSWFGWDVSKIGPLRLDGEDREIFEVAVAFSKSIRAGEVKVKQDQSHDDGPRHGSAPPRVADVDDSIPF